MSKAVLISIKPEWCAKIASGEKTIEVRKTRPKLSTPFKCYIYCTACRSYFRATEHMAFGDDELYRDENRNIKYGSSIELMCAENYDSSYFLNQKVIGEFICDDIDEISVHYDTLYCVNNTQPKKLGQMCMTLDDVMTYLGEKNNGFTWHISDLVIYNKPKDLSEFYMPGTLSNEDYLSTIYDGSGDPMRSSYASYLFTRQLRCPTQSWCYVEELT